MSMSKNVGKLFTFQNVLILLGFIVLAIGFGLYQSGKLSVKENYGARGPVALNAAPVGRNKPAPSNPAPKLKQQSNGKTLTANDLLPKKTNGSLGPKGVAPNQNGAIHLPLDPHKQIGINTVGQSLRNANLQLRSEPPNPQTKVGPWNNTTIEPDLTRRPLEDCQ